MVPTPVISKAEMEIISTSCRQLTHIAKMIAEILECDVPLKENVASFLSEKAMSFRKQVLSYASYPLVEIATQFNSIKDIINRLYMLSFIPKSYSGEDIMNKAFIIFKGSEKEHIEETAALEKLHEMHKAVYTVAGMNTPDFSPTSEKFAEILKQISAYGFISDNNFNAEVNTLKDLAGLVNYALTGYNSTIIRNRLSEMTAHNNITRWHILMAYNIVNTFYDMIGFAKI